MKIDQLKPGQHVRITQTIARREGTWHDSVAGMILTVRPEKTGSWYAHARDGRLWLRRIRLEKEDGEITTLAIDPQTRIEQLPAPTEAQ